MKNIFKTILVIFISFEFILGGTDGTIRGKVTDIEKNPLPGANIYVPSVGVGAAADMDGNYIITLSMHKQHPLVMQLQHITQILFILPSLIHLLYHPIKISQSLINHAFQVL